MKFDPRRNHPAYEVSSPLPPPPKAPSTSYMARAATMPLAKLLALAVTAATALVGLVTATGAAVVQVINATAEANARKSNTEISRRLDLVETRVNGDFGLPLETKARQAKEAEVEDELGRLRARVRKLEARD